MEIRIALIGDYSANVLAHQAIPIALRAASSKIAPYALQFDWKHTSTIGALDGYHGVWCVPASPYADEEAAIGAIRWAREGRVPFLGTCGGFQHAVIEFARHVMGIAGARHEETAPDSDCLVISRLACSLVEVQGTVMASAGSRLSELFGTEPIRFGYHCNFGLNPKFEEALQQAGMRISARDYGSGTAGEVRAIELGDHPFFVATLFQPERDVLRGENSRIVDGFVRAASAFANQRANAISAH